jgi:hypothetical protein
MHGRGEAIHRAGDSLLRIGGQVGARWRTFGTECLWINRWSSTGAPHGWRACRRHALPNRTKRLREARAVAEHGKVRFAFVMSSAARLGA